jgi:hypothetical protein
VPVLLRRLLVLVAVVAAVAAGPACSKKKPGQTASPKTTAASTTSTAPGAAPTVKFNIIGLEDNGTKAPDDATKAAVLGTVEQWADQAVVAPLHTGQPAGDLTALFTPAAAAKFADPATRAAFVDEGLPAALTSLSVDKADATLSSVAGSDEVLGVIGVRVDLRLHAVGPELDVDVVHWGELILAPVDNGWKIDGFDLHSSRDSRGAP